jgi:5-hydroxyisourate hydrolase-like protein (transthyretin family)
MEDVHNGHLKVTLKEYIESKLQAIEKATDEAKERIDERLSGMNEFRHQLDKQAGTFYTKIEADALRETLKTEFQVFSQANHHAHLYIIISVIGLMITGLSAMILLHQFLK